MSRCDLTDREWDEGEIHDELERQRGQHDQREGHRKGQQDAQIDGDEEQVEKRARRRADEEVPNGVGFADAGDGFAHRPFPEAAERKPEQVIELVLDPVRGQDAEQFGQRLETAGSGR